MTEAFDRMVNEFQDRVYNTCLGFLKNAEDAEDTAQEVFIKLYKSMDSFRGESEIGTWIYRVTINKCLEQLRKAKRQKRSGHQVEITDQLQIASSFYHPGVELENKERSAILFRAIDQLLEPQRVAFTLHKVEGLSYEEISKIMEKSIPSVESLIHRAKLSLRKQLETYYQHELN